MGLVYVLSTLLLAVMLVLSGGIILRLVACPPFGASRVEEIRRLRQEGLAVNQDGEG